MTFDPWEGTQARIKRSGSWGNWTSCVDNGDVVFYLGAESIEATDIEVKDTQGTVTPYEVDITAGE